jgi:hypothetical protein
MGIEMAASLDRELETYAKHRDELLGKSAGQYALIHKDEVLGVYESKSDALKEGYRRLGNVPFLVKEIVPVESATTFVASFVVTP